MYASPFLYPYFHPMFHPYLMAAAAQANAAAASTVRPLSFTRPLLTRSPLQEKTSADGQTANPYNTAPSPLSAFPGFNPGELRDVIEKDAHSNCMPLVAMPFAPLYPPGMMNPSFRPNLFNGFSMPIPTPGTRPPPPTHSASSSSSTSSNRHHHHQQNFDGSPRK